MHISADYAAERRGFHNCAKTYCVLMFLTVLDQA